MQAFSGMRRSSTSKRNLTSPGSIIFLIFYQMAASLYIYLTPLIGVVFCYLVLNMEKERRTHRDLAASRYLAILYLIYVDLNKGFYLFSGVLFFYLFHFLFAEWFQTSFKCKNCVIVAYVISGYLGIFGTNNLLAYISNEHFFEFGWEYGFYMISDIIISMIVFKERFS